MAWTNLATRVANTDGNAAADVNALMADLLLIKGGVAATTPTTTLEAEAALLDTAQADILSLQTTYVADTSSTQTLVYTSDNKTYNPTSDHDVTLPTTSVAAGWTRKIQNRNTTKVLTVKASGGNTVCKIIPKAWVIFQSRQAVPTDETHWMQADAGGGWAALPALTYGTDFGTVTPESFFARREGPDYRIRGSFTYGTLGAGTDVSLTLPYSFSIATASCPTYAWLGMAQALDSTLLADGRMSWINYDGSTATKVFFARNEAAGTWQKSSGANTFLSNAKSLVVDMLIPISTWELG